MAPAAPTTHSAPSDDELDYILNEVIDGRDTFDTSNIQPQTETQDSRRPAGTNTDANLGIDEEIKIEKKRQPIPKLDVERLLSPAGIPRLQRISKERLRFKGKGHEVGSPPCSGFQLLTVFSTEISLEC
jgi:replication fork protection complex subunit Csm3/Swi3